MNLQHLNDQELDLQTQKAVQDERSATTMVLHHLREVDRRRLFSKFKYKSLHEYAEKRLKYPGEQAYRRIAAMRLLKELPELEEKINSGSLSLTHITDAKKVFKKKKHTRQEKLALFERLTDTSTRAAQRVLSEIVPMGKNYQLEDKIRELMGYYPGLSRDELLEKLVDQDLERKRAEHSRTTPRQKKDSQAEIVRQVRRRDNHCCSNCGSTYALEIDHMIPKAKGGKDTLENLRLLCRKCNQRAAIEHFDYMDRYLKDKEVAYEIRGAANFYGTTSAMGSASDCGTLRSLHLPRKTASFGEVRFRPRTQ